ncbi:aminopeptidase M1-like protein isoform X1 [Tanacetum coccineum]
MDIWTKKMGYPLIYVKLEENTLEFEQTRFTLLGLQGEGQWVGPITLSVGSYSNRKNFLLETKVGKLDLSELNHSHYSSSQPNGNKTLEVAEKPWVKVNVWHTGFYRVKYDSTFTARFRKAIEENCLVSKMGSGQNKSFLYGSGLVDPKHFLSTCIPDDANALCEAGEESILSILSLMDLYRDDLNYLVLSRLISVLLLWF